jgi:hypothetical protein
MAITVKALGAGTITASGTATLYTVPTSKSAAVNNLRLINAGTATSGALNLYVKPSGSGSTARLIYKKNFTMSNVTPNANLIITDAITLGQGDAIQLVDNDSAPSIGYMVSGVERDM